VQPRFFRRRVCGEGMGDSSISLQFCDLFSTITLPSTENLDQMESALCVVGGASVARILRRSFDITLALRTCFQEGVQDNRPTAKDLVIINRDTAKAVDIAWEKLHTGVWSDACLAWRELFVVGTLLFVLTGLIIDVVEPGSRTFSLESSSRVQIAALLGVPEHHGLFQASLEQVLNASIGETPAQERKRYMLAQVLEPWVIGCKSNGIAPANFMRKRFGPRTPHLPSGSLICGTTPVRRPVQHLIWPPSGCAESRNTAPVLKGLGSAPFVISGAGEGWPALYKWRDPEYLIRFTDDRVVPIECGENYLHCTWTQRLMPMTEFMENYVRPFKSEQRACSVAHNLNRRNKIRPGALHTGWQRREPQERTDKNMSRKGYLAQHDIFSQAPCLLSDFDFRKFCAVGSNTRGSFSKVFVWIGPVGTTSPLHTDPHDNFFSQIVGYKYVRLYAPSCETTLYRNTVAKFCNSSQVKLDEPLMEMVSKFPDVLSAPYVDCILGPGDILHIPPLHWHYVQSLTSSISVTMWCCHRQVSRINFRAST
jgi:[histone H3]-dimethyl/trimethyl-L-lysine36 demethylase